MKKLQIVLLSLIVLNATAFGQTKIIFDTDFGGDADDLGALAMLHHFVNNDECELLAIMSWSHEKYAIPAIDAVNRYYGHPDIPIGVRSYGDYEEPWHYNKAIVDRLPSKKSLTDATLAADLYRKILMEQEDKGITIVTVGPLKNILDLLNSPPDHYSPLYGRELVEKKVKEFVVMGGKFPSGEGEWNFDGGMKNVSKDVFDILSTPVVFLGYEIGWQIQTGTAFNELDQNTPLYAGFKHFSEHAPWMKERYKGEILNNSSYDQTAVYYAVRGGLGRLWDKVEKGSVEIDTDGGNRWIISPDKNQTYLVLKETPVKMAEIIENSMLGNLEE